MTTALERLRAAMTDPSRLAPVSRTLGVRVLAAERGEVRAALPAHPLSAPVALLALADFVLGAAVGTALPAGHRSATLTLHATLLTGPPDGPLTGDGRLVDLRDGSGVARAEIRAGDAVVAVFGARCAALPAGASAVRPPRPGRPDPGSAAAWPELVGGGGSARLRADPCLANTGATVQGGLLAAVLARALDAEGAGTELDVTYLRPVPPDGGPITATATPLHDGRRLRHGRAELRDAAGRPAALATATVWREGS